MSLINLLSAETVNGLQRLKTALEAKVTPATVEIARERVEANNREEVRRVAAKVAPMERKPMPSIVKYTEPNRLFVTGTVDVAPDGTVVRHNLSASNKAPEIKRVATPISREEADRRVGVINAATRSVQKRTIDDVLPSLNRAAKDWGLDAFVSIAWEAPNFRLLLKGTTKSILVLPENAVTVLRTFMCFGLPPIPTAEPVEVTPPKGERTAKVAKAKTKVAVAKRKKSVVKTAKSKSVGKVVKKTAKKR